MSGNPSMLDRENLIKRLEEAQKRHSRMKEQKIRWESELERYQQDLARLKQEAFDAFGTSDPEELLKMEEELIKKATQEVLAFEQSVSSIAERLNEIQSAKG